MDNKKKSPPKKVLKGEDFRPNDSEINPVGRPSTYNEEIVSEILMRVSCGESIRSICRDDHMPGARTVWKWKLQNPDFERQYTRARDDGCDAIADELFTIADDGTNDYMENADGEQEYNGDHIQRSKLRVDTRKWYLSKIAQKTFGDKLETTVIDPYKDMTRDQILEELEALMSKRLANLPATARKELPAVQ